MLGLLSERVQLYQRLSVESGPDQLPRLSHRERPYAPCVHSRVPRSVDSLQSSTNVYFGLTSVIRTDSRRIARLLGWTRLQRVRGAIRARLRRCILQEQLGEQRQDALGVYVLWVSTVTARRNRALMHTIQRHELGSNRLSRRIHKVRRNLLKTSQSLDANIVIP